MTSSSSPPSIGLPTRMIVAAIGGSGAATVCHPFDLIRVQLQVAGANAYKGPMDAAIKQVQAHGISRGLYTGLTAAYLRQWTYGACRVGIYGYLQEEVSKRQNTPVTTIQRIGMGLTSGGIGSFIGTPSELALVQMTADARLPMAERRGYRNIFHCLSVIQKEHGVQGMWQGATPTVLRAMLLTASLLPTYTKMKIVLHEWKPDIFSEAGLLTMFVGTSIGSFAANLIVNPVDVVKSRLQNMAKTQPPKYTSMADCFVKSVQAEGPMVLMRGFGPAFLKLAPYTCISLIITEKITFAITGSAAL